MQQREGLDAADNLIFKTLNRNVQKVELKQMLQCAKEKGKITSNSGCQTKGPICTLSLGHGYENSHLKAYFGPNILSSTHTKTPIFQCTYWGKAITHCIIQKNELTKTLGQTGKTRLA